MDLFTREDFKIGTYSYSWDNRRWNRLLKQGWITVWRKHNRTTQKYNIYKVSFKCKQLISRMYRIMLGKEDIPTSTARNKIMKGKTYIDKVMITSINHVNKDKKQIIMGKKEKKVKEEVIKKDYSKIDKKIDKLKEIIKILEAKKK